MSGARNLTAKEVLDLIPQQEPFRFIDEILEIDEDHIVASYTWRADADFYRGHFPGNPITPGVLLVESMAQTGVVALGLYTLASQGGIDDAKKLVTVFTDANVDFSGLVKPGARVVITGRKLFYRRRKLRSEVEMHLEDGTLVCSGVLSGMGVTQ
ncbi:MAG: beta-hydroxyacyl-ACP dehydratase [Myxococcales bacterium]|nr:beta-hydroxyacyl-ACP dehydratase [Myxococcales bacterium]